MVFICGFLFSIGVFKEYLYYSLFPQLMAMPMLVMSEAAAETIYSVMTAVPYYFATPAMLVTGLYFSRMEKRRPGLFPWITLISFLPGIVMSIVYPITRTRYFQLNDRTYYTIISIYNVAVALTATFFFLNALIKERNPKVKRQKLAIAVLALVPSWFTIMSTIPIQLFSVEGAEKAWQGNLIIIIVLVGMYFVLVFKEGFMGSRLRHETYRWGSRRKTGRTDYRYSSAYDKEPDGQDQLVRREHVFRSGRKRNPGVCRHYTPGDAENLGFFEYQYKGRFGV